MWASLSGNRVLIAGLLGWIIGQGLKLPFDFFINKHWNWRIIFGAGGMPSSHSALVTSVALSIGFQEGFGSSLFALAFAVAMVVVYDAAGVRRQAGIHAERINQIMQNFLEGRHMQEGELKEVLGHTVFEVAGGILLGLLIALCVFWLVPG